MGSHSLPQEIFLTQGSDQSLLHCREILYHLSHQGSPYLNNSLYKVQSVPFWTRKGWFYQLHFLQINQVMVREAKWAHKMAQPHAMESAWRRSAPAPRRGISVKAFSPCPTRWNQREGVQPLPHAMELAWRRSAPAQGFCSCPTQPASYWRFTAEFGLPPVRDYLIIAC